MRKILFLVFCITTFIYNSAAATSITPILNETAAYVYENTPDPTIGSVGGEWAILGLARSGYPVPEHYYERYYQNVCANITEHSGVLSTNKYTEYSRVITALTAIGKDPSNVAGYDLLIPIGDYDRTMAQGLNGAIWALIALDCGDYTIPYNSTASTHATRELYLNSILDRQLPDGGWALTRNSTASDPDITAMALQALAKYRTRQNVKKAVISALDFLSSNQEADGGFSSKGESNSETCSQVLVALGELGIHTNDKRFIKNGNTVLDKLLTYKVSYGFSHSGSEIDPMSTEQALYALAAINISDTTTGSLYSISRNNHSLSACEYIRMNTILKSLGN